jgi:hypothetical protein
MIQHVRCVREEILYLPCGISFRVLAIALRVPGIAKHCHVYQRHTVEEYRRQRHDEDPNNTGDPCCQAISATNDHRHHDHTTRTVLGRFGRSGVRVGKGQWIRSW